jgi:Outer membrane lipoprotein carrier protein LolA-like
MPCADWDQRFHQRLTQATAPDALVRILAAHKGNGFSTTFTEEKRMTVLRKPLTSSGQLLFIPTHGLYRHLQQPFVQEMLITPEAIHQRQASDRTTALALDTLPGAKAFVGAFLALFSGSWDALLTHFEVYFSQDKSQWHLGLKPTNEAMAKMMTCLVLEGTQTHLGALWMQESNGDVTYDRFLDAQMVPETQWAAYQSQFDWAR